MKQLSGMDAMFVFSERAGLSQNMTAVWIYDPSTAPTGKVSFEQILAFYETRLMKVPLFRRRLYEVPFNLDRPYWLEDSGFDISRHVHHMALPKPGTWEQLSRLAAHLHSMPMDPSKPLWEIYVIDGLDAVEGYPPGCFAVARKNHHSSLDGMSGMKMEEILHDTSPRAPRAKRRPRPALEAEQPRPLVMLGKALRNTAQIPARFAGLARTIISAQTAQGKLEQRTPSLVVPKTRFQGVIGRERVLDGLSLDFDELRAIKSTVSEASINDVLLAIAGGALRKYLGDEHELPAESLVCVCPIDVRTPSESESGGNVIGQMQVRLHTEIAKPLERLAAVHEDARLAKARAASGEARAVMQFFDALPSPLVSVLARAGSTDFAARRSLLGNTMLSNMPGPKSQCYLCGAKLVGMLLGPPLEFGTGLLHAAISNVLDGKGAVTLGFASTPDMMPDPAVYRECLRESFEQMKRAARVAGVSSSPRRHHVERNAPPSPRRGRRSHRPA